MTLRDPMVLRLHLATGIIFASLSAWVHSYPHYHASRPALAAAAAIGFALGVSASATLAWMVGRRADREAPTPAPDALDEWFDGVPR